MIEIYRKRESGGNCNANWLTMPSGYIKTITRLILNRISITMRAAKANLPVVVPKKKLRATPIDGI